MSNLEELKSKATELAEAIQEIDVTSMEASELQGYLDLSEIILRPLQDKAIQWTAAATSRYEDDPIYEWAYDYEMGNLEDDADIPREVEVDGKVYMEDDFWRITDDVYQLLSFNGAHWGYRDTEHSWGGPEWQWTDGWASSYC